MNLNWREKAVWTVVVWLPTQATKLERPAFSWRVAIRKMNYTWVFDIIIFAAAVLAVILLRPRNGEFFKDVHSRHPFTSRALGATGM